MNESPMHTGSDQASVDEWLVAGDASVGARSQQEDYHYFGRTRDFDGTGWLLILADGMGGHSAGERASEIAVLEFKGQFETRSGTIPQRLEAALLAANEALADAVTDEPQLSGMGCTLLAAHLGPAGLHWISVGDSPLWLVKGTKLQRLNADHSMRAVLEAAVAAGRITAEQASRDPKRSGLLSALTGDEISQIDLSPQPRVLAANDLVLAASDGILTLDERTILRVVSSAHAAKDDHARRAVDALLAELGRINQPGQDNCTAIVAMRSPRTRKRLFGIFGGLAFALLLMCGGGARL